MKTKFEIKSDLEFYCYLKSNLPSGYKIVSEPNKSYFEEWYYCYKIFYKDKLIKEFGEDGSRGLIYEAEKKLSRLDEMRRVFVVAKKI